MPEMPSGTVTFLFTDIEGSTVRWEQHPTAMREALARHDALLHEGIATHRGVVVTERGEGDSFFALFARPSDALAAACALQRALASAPWLEEIAPLRVRMALHTGEAGLWEGRDYRGAAVNRCARLRAVAHGGQVLLSGVTYELVRDHLPPMITVRDLGEHRLKDLTRPEHIVQLVIPGAPADFPPLKSLDQQRHNLPVQPTVLIGREHEVREVRERLLDPQTRLLTLTGAGGMGKTRLAVQVAAEVLDAFPDGACFVNLAPLVDPDLVLPTIVQTLGLTEPVGRPLRDTLHAFLHDREELLLLDNFEQVLEAAAVVADLLAACARVRVLVTSRAALHLRGERLYPVPPLALPEVSPLPPLEGLVQYEAVRLFVERARDVKPDFIVTNATAPAVAEVCARLDGLPLAIELAAARVRLFPPQALLARLDHRLGVLTGGARDLPERHRTLRATIDWSYSLLTVEEQTLFARLSVFVGGATLDAIEVVCTSEGACDVLRGVESLLEKNLLGQTEAGDEPRFVMLETLHEYARERLEACGETDALRRAHATYFLTLAEAAGPQLTGPEQGLWLERLEREHDNLRAALSWAHESAEIAELGRPLAVALWRFWDVHGHFSEGRRWLERAAAGVRPEDAGLSRPAAGQVQALYGAGFLAWRQGDYARATILFEESLALFRWLGDRAGIARALDGLGNVAANRNDYVGAVLLHEQALSVRHELGDKGAYADTLNDLGVATGMQGDHVRAALLHEESLTLRRELDDRGGIASSLNNLGVAAEMQGEFERARLLYEESVALFRELGDRVGVANVVNGLASVAIKQGDEARATALYEESLGLFWEVGDKAGIAAGLEGLAHAATKPEARRAAQLLGAADALRAAISAPLSSVERTHFDRTMTAVRSALGEDAIAAAWAAGQALSLEQAVAYALEDGPELQP